MAKVYFYGCDLNWKTVEIDWEANGKDILLAGTPLDKDGNIANNANCVGLLMEDAKPNQKTVRAVYRGETKFDVLEANCGIALSDEVMDVLDIYEHGIANAGGVTVLYSDDNYGYLYHDDSYTTKVTKSEFVEMVDKGLIWVWFDGHNGIVVSYYISGDGSVEVQYLDVTGGEVGTRYAYTAEYVNEGPK